MAKKADGGFDAHVMDWVSELIPGRLLVGPFPKSAFDLAYLAQKQGVRYIVSLKEHSDVKTPKGFNKWNWYECFLSSRLFKRESEKPELLSEPLPAGFSKLNQANQIAHYAAIATKISEAVAGRPGAIYIHYNTGFEEEAFVAFLVWAKIEKATLPKNIGDWLVAKNYDQLLQDKEESRKMIQTALEQLTSAPRTIASMFESMKKKQKI
jgi:hypothetical protein